VTLKSHDVQKLIDDNDALLRRMAELGIETANVATALTSRGAPAPETILQELAELGRLFAALRSEAFAAASRLALPLPPLEAVSSAADLKAMLEALYVSVKAAERQAEVVVARESALNTLGRVALLAHVDHARFEPLQMCQEQACKLRSALEQQTGEPDRAAMTPFAELLTFIDSARDLDDEKWSMLHDSITGAFGAPLAMAAGRGRLTLTAVRR
jgi:hypothetical protein